MSDMGQGADICAGTVRRPDDRRHRAACGISCRPAGQTLRHIVESEDAAIGVSGDETRTDDAQRRRQAEFGIEQVLLGGPAHGDLTLELRKTSSSWSTEGILSISGSSSQSPTAVTTEIIAVNILVTACAPQAGTQTVRVSMMWVIPQPKMNTLNSTATQR
jgi:hypothetical protein